MLATRVPATLKRRIRVYCAEHDIDMRQLIEEAVRERLRAVKQGR